MSPSKINAFSAENTELNGSVLLIENDLFVCDALNEILSSSGLRVYVARDGVEGEAMFRAYQDDIDMVILDWRLPKQNGRETLRKIRQLNPNIGVMVSSGYEAEEVFKQMDDQRPFTFLGKPFDMDTLLTQVQKLLA